MDAVHLVVLALAVARLARLIVHDSLTERPRTWLLRRWPTDDTEFGDSEVTETGKDTLGFRIGHLSTGVMVFRTPNAWYAQTPHKWSELLTCVWCSSVWVGIAVWTAYWFYPDAVYWLVPLALSQIAGLLDRH
jgi:hypothetical protein